MKPIKKGQRIRLRIPKFVNQGFLQNDLTEEREYECLGYSGKFKHLFCDETAKDYYLTNEQIEQYRV